MVSPRPEKVTGKLTEPRGCTEGMRVLGLRPYTVVARLQASFVILWLMGGDQPQT